MQAELGQLGQLGQLLLTAEVSATAADVDAGVYSGLVFTVGWRIH